MNEFIHQICYHLELYLLEYNLLYYMSATISEEDSCDIILRNICPFQRTAQHCIRVYITLPNHRYDKLKSYILSFLLPTIFCGPLLTQYGASSCCGWTRPIPRVKNNCEYNISGQPKRGCAPPRWLETKNRSQYTRTWNITLCYTGFSPVEIL